jgi:hypothetical protein
MISEGNFCRLLPHSRILASANSLQKARYMKKRSLSCRSLWSWRSPFKSRVCFVFSYLDTTTSGFRTYFVLRCGISAPFSQFWGLHNGILLRPTTGRRLRFVSCSQKHANPLFLRVCTFKLGVVHTPVKVLSHPPFFLRRIARACRSLFTSAALMV